MAGNQATVELGIFADNQASGEIQQVSEDLAAMEEQVQAASEALDRSAESLEGTAEGAEEASGAFGELIDNAKEMAGALAALLSVEAAVGMVAMADSLEGYTDALFNAVGEEDAYNQILEKTYAISQLTSTSFEANMTAITALTRGVQVHGRSIQEASLLHEVLAKSVKVSGSSAEQAEAAYDALAEAMQFGIVEGGHVEQMLLNNSAFAEELAQSLGTTTVGLLAMAEGMQLTVDKVMGALPKMAEGIQERFEGVSLGIEDAFIRIRNAFTKSVMDANSASGGANKIALEINNIAVMIEQHSDVVAGFFETIATGAAYAVRGVFAVDGIFRGAAAAATVLAVHVLDAAKAIVELAGQVGLIDDAAAKVAEIDMLIEAAEQSSVDLAQQARNSWSLVFQSTKDAAKGVADYNEELDKADVKIDNIVNKSKESSAVSFIISSDGVDELSESLDVLREKLYGIRQTYADGNLVIDASPDTSKELERQISLLTQEKIIAQQTGNEFSIVEGKLVNNSSAMQDAIKSAEELGVASRELKTTWVLIDGTWTEVLEDGRTLAEAMKTEIIDSSEAAAEMAANMAAAASPASEVSEIIAGLVDGYDAASGASGELAENINALAEKKAQLSLLDGEIAKLEVHLERSRDNAEQTKQLLAEMAVAEAAQRALSAEIGELESAIDGAGEAAEETAKKIEEIPTASTAAAEASKAIASSTREQVAAVEELAAAVDEVVKKATAATYQFSTRNIESYSDEELQKALEQEQKIIQTLEAQTNVQVTVDRERLSKLQAEERRRSGESGGSIDSSYYSAAGFSTGGRQEQDSLKPQLDQLSASVAKLAVSLESSQQRPQQTTINITGLQNVDQIDQELRRRGFKVSR